MNSGKMVSSMITVIGSMQDFFPRPRRVSKDVLGEVKFELGFKR